MSARRFFARAALFAYPAEFRSQFGDQMVADIEDDPTASLLQLWDVIGNGAAMRADSFGGDFSYALRRLRRAPLFLAVVILTFALGIGANIAVFSVLNAVVLRPLPFPDGSSLVQLLSRDPQGHLFPALSITDASDMRAQARSISQIAAVSFAHGSLVVNAKPHALSGLSVMADYFSMLRITPELGRVFTPADAAHGIHNVIISDEVWRKYFAADPRVIGRAVQIDAISYRVVGVLNAKQPLPDAQSATIDPRDFLFALPKRGTAADRGVRMGGAIARLAPGVTPAQANAELKVISERLTQFYSRSKNAFSVRSFRDAMLNDVTSSLWVIFGAVIATLLIACANIGNMLAARWSARDREFAVRRALGASTRRICAQLLIETGMLAFCGTVVGVVLAYAALNVIAGLIAKALPRADTISIDGSTFVYALLLVVVASLLAAALPLHNVRSADIQSILKSAGRGGEGSQRNHLRAALVVFEVAVALALLTVSGLILRGFVQLVNTPLGIRPQGVVVTEPLILPNRDASTGAQTNLVRSLLPRLQSLPGAKYAALALYYPESDMDMESTAAVLGTQYKKGEEPLTAVNVITPKYFEALGIPVLRGRPFTDDDNDGSPPVAIVNQRFVEQYLRGRNALGVRIRVETGPTTFRWASIVGVVGNERVSHAAAMNPEYYLPMSQPGGPSVLGVICGIVYAPGVDPAAMGREVQRAYAATLPLIEPPDTFTFAQRIAADTIQERLTTTLVGALALVALLLALSGIFGVVSFSVTQRIHELGVRIALGASAPAIVFDVMRRTLTTTAIGIAFGLIIAALAARASASQLDGISPLDPLTFGSVIGFIVLSATVAALAPAFRATRVEPVESLRYE